MDNREIDALVAEKIFGKPLSCYDCPHFDKKTGRMLSFCGCPDLPCYSTDIAAAWDVVEKLWDDGRWAELRTSWGKEEDWDGYWCGFTPHLTTGWNGVPDYQTSAPTMPLAICLAALKVKGIEVENGSR